MVIIHLKEYFTALMFREDDHINLNNGLMWYMIYVREMHYMYDRGTKHKDNAGIWK